VPPKTIHFNSAEKADIYIHHQHHPIQMIHYTFKYIGTMRRGVCTGYVRGIKLVSNKYILTLQPRSTGSRCCLWWSTCCHRSSCTPESRDRMWTAAIRPYRRNGRSSSTHTTSTHRTPATVVMVSKMVWTIRRHVRCYVNEIRIY